MYSELNLSIITDNAPPLSRLREMKLNRAAIDVFATAWIMILTYMPRSSFTIWDVAARLVAKHIATYQKRRDLYTEYKLVYTIPFRDSLVVE